MAAKKKIMIVVGTRPNFIKVTQFRRVLAGHPSMEMVLVHTGQHFDERMSTVFFEQFGLTPDLFLNIGQGSPNTQMANIMLGLEKAILEYQPDIVLVPGDVNSTLAAALAANKTGVKLGHIESGLRSFDRSMPEEFNRVLTDLMADHFFVTEQSGMDHLLKEGHKKEYIHFVGNTMIDTMVAFSSQIESSDIVSRFGLEPKQFVLMTMHRPATVDHKEGLTQLLELIRSVTKKYKVVFPIHPRTVKKLREFGMYDWMNNNEGLQMTDPLDYFAFQKLVKECKLIITDSGGIQEESTFLGVPCLTLRPNTERPVTVTLGTNLILPFEIPVIMEKVAMVEAGTFKKGIVPPMWDGKSTERIVQTLSKIL